MFKPYEPFTPEAGGTRPVLVGVASARVSLDGYAGDHLELFNSGSAVVFVQFGTVTVTASTGTAHATTPTKGSYPIGPGIVVMVKREREYTHMAHISGTAAQTLYVTPGTGI
jgi:hypothetical protein